MKTILNLKTGDVVNCVEQKTGQRYTGIVKNADEKSALLKFVGTTSYVELTEFSDVERRGKTIMFHG